ncbi:MAG: S9 family peptidase [Microscillaceae bacterium]|nr:S9 family peptidase [Microscillaceae bacterium]MDW8459857.1 S9 family peptidase [Cytophagales bacterium]
MNNVYFSFKIVLLNSFIILFAGALIAQKEVSAPRAPKKPTILTAFGKQRIDNYYWLKDRQNPEVIQYLEQENRYAEQMLAPAAPLKQKILEEVRSRINPQESSPYYQIGNYFYYQRYELGQEYPKYCRKKGNIQAEEEVLFDVAMMAQNKEVYELETFTPSDDHNYVALAIDTLGNNIFTLYFKDLRTGKMLDDVIPYCAGVVVWASDNKTVFYNTINPQTLRADQIKKHILGTPVSKDEILINEKDTQFSVSLMRSRSREYIFFSIDSVTSTEQYFIKANQPDQKPEMIVSRKQKGSYFTEHITEKGEDVFVMLTDYQAPNGRIIKCPVKEYKKGTWQEVVPHSDSTLIESFQAYKGFLVLKEQKNGLDAIRIINLLKNTQYYLPFIEPTFSVELDENMRTDTQTLRYIYTSFTTPTTYFDLDLVNQKQTLVKQEKILGNFSPAFYDTERIFAPAPDSTLVPISLVYRKGLVKNGENPLILYGYGAYGISEKPAFLPDLLSLLDRGFVYAIAHVRGGKEMGKAWYEQGKLLNKKNSFSDYIACAEYLIQKQYTKPQYLVAMGASAGGLLVATVLNQRPELFKAAVLEVPFVDVVTTMSDETLPLTTGEFEEWGNPKEKIYYDYMLSYSPYDQIKAQNYPHILVTTALNDSQVQYFEPAKWVAKMREMKTDNNLLLLKIDKNTGHVGKTGRFQQYEDIATNYSFILYALGINE